MLKGLLPFKCFVKILIIFCRSIELSHQVSRNFLLFQLYVDETKQCRFGGVLVPDTSKIQDNVFAGLSTKLPILDSHI